MRKVFIRGYQGVRLRITGLQGVKLVYKASK